MFCGGGGMTQLLDWDDVDHLKLNIYLVKFPTQTTSNAITGLVFGCGLDLGVHL